MQNKYCFYIHHHGAGHVTRAIAIAKALSSHQICFMGSNLRTYQQIIPSYVYCIDLPSDLPESIDKFYEERSVSYLHYAPLKVQGLRERNKLIISYFSDNPDSLFIVDVSAEVTMLARICGVPTVTFRQHGKRGDIAHQLAYENAELIVAPYSKSMSNVHEEGLFGDKTFFSGGFSKYTNTKKVLNKSSDSHLAVFVGQGGTCINKDFIRYLRLQVSSNYHLHVIGQTDKDCALMNCTFHGHLRYPKHILDLCNIVICNAGHNTVMEMADLRKRIICIPAKRPFGEQETKCEHLQRLGLAVIVQEDELYQIDWDECIQRVKTIDITTWAEIMNPGAIQTIVERLDMVYENLFRTPQRFTLSELIQE